MIKINDVKKGTVGQFVVRLRIAQMEKFYDKYEDFGIPGWICRITIPAHTMKASKAWLKKQISGDYDLIEIDEENTFENTNYHVLFLHNEQDLTMLAIQCPYNAS